MYQRPQETPQAGRNISRQKFFFKGPTKLGESPYEKAEVSTLDEMGFSELEAHSWGSCACSRVFRCPEDVAAVSPITGSHMCRTCAQTVCPGCLRVVSPISDMRALFGHPLCSDCFKHKFMRLILGLALLIPLAIIICWWLVR